MVATSYCAKPYGEWNEMRRKISRVASFEDIQLKICNKNGLVIKDFNCNSYRFVIMYVLAGNSWIGSIFINLCLLVYYACCC